MFRPLPYLLGLTLAGTALAQTPAVQRLPEVTTTTSANGAPSTLREEQPVDETGRPGWTTMRRFPTTRVYLQQSPGTAGVEQWWRYRRNRDGTSESRIQEEVEIGLPYRMQLDIYETWKADDHHHAQHDYLSFELRYALADWGKIWGNPTLYGEYKVVNEGADVYELKLLLGDQIMPRLHWAVNGVWEKQVGDERESEAQLVAGLSWTAIDEIMSFGAEAKYVYFTDRTSRGEPEQGVMVGPSVQIRPTRNTSLDLVGLIGLNDDAPAFEGYLVFSVQFGKVVGSREKHAYNPVSVRSN